MIILVYRGLDTTAIPGYEKLAASLAADDFRSADVKKVGDNLYRARLDRNNRLLFSLYRHKGERCALMLEYIHQHTRNRGSSPVVRTLMRSGFRQWTPGRPPRPRSCRI